MKIIQFSVGDYLFLKKKHPCGSNIFRPARLGSDVKIVCKKCGKDITIKREALEKMIKNVIPYKEYESN